MPPVLLERTGEFLGQGFELYLCGARVLGGKEPFNSLQAPLGLPQQVIPQQLLLLTWPTGLCTWMVCKLNLPHGGLAQVTSGEMLYRMVDMHIVQNKII